MRIADMQIYLTNHQTIPSLPENFNGKLYTVQFARNHLHVVDFTERTLHVFDSKKDCMGDEIRRNYQNSIIEMLNLRYKINIDECQLIFEDKTILAISPYISTKRLSHNLNFCQQFNVHF
jgi:hypothetical protein